MVCALSVATRLPSGLALQSGEAVEDVGQLGIGGAGANLCSKGHTREYRRSVHDAQCYAWPGIASGANDEGR